eukprot:Tbor_TRINITY_DN3289_c0_g1::TRINITY_DN3289_c0_g1_i1::g.23711::m.23711/K08850/AURKX; aurora kinase, other
MSSISSVRRNVVSPGSSLPNGLRILGEVIVVPPQPQSQWKQSDFEFLYRLGGGNYGQAFMASVRGTNYLVALKKIPIAQLAQDNIAMQLRREVEIAFNVRHKNVLRTYGYFFDENDVYLILEPCAGGMLYTHLTRAKRFRVEVAARYVAQLAEALLYLHQHHILHRDIKPENILIDHKGDLKLSDFGWSVHDPENRRKTSCGTPEYFPPEIVLRKAYDTSADVWCVGVFCYEMLIGQTPFVDKDRKKIYKKIETLSYSFPSGFPEDAKDLVQRLLIMDGSKRMNLHDVLRHEFLVKNYYQLIDQEPPSMFKRPRGD